MRRRLASRIAAWRASSFFACSASFFLLGLLGGALALGFSRFGFGRASLPRAWLRARPRLRAASARSRSPRWRAFSRAAAPLDRDLRVGARRRRAAGLGDGRRRRRASARPAAAASVRRRAAGARRRRLRQRRPQLGDDALGLARLPVDAPGQREDQQARARGARAPAPSACRAAAAARSGRARGRRCHRSEPQPRGSSAALALDREADALDAGALQRVHHLDDGLVADVAGRPRSRPASSRRRPARRARARRRRRARAAATPCRRRAGAAPRRRRRRARSTCGRLRCCALPTLGRSTTPVVISGAVTMKMISSTSMTSMNGTMLISLIVRRREPRWRTAGIGASLAHAAGRRRRRRRHRAGVALQDVRELLDEGLELDGDAVDVAREAVVGDHRRDRGEQADRGGDQRLGDAGRDGGERHLRQVRQADERMHDSPHRAEQADVGRHRADRGEERQVATRSRRARAGSSRASRGARRRAGRRCR